jgi:hypothetical protein
MAEFTVVQNYNDPWHHDIRYRGDVVEFSDDTPDDDDTVGKAQARQRKDLVRRGLLKEGKHSKEDLDKADQEEAEKAENEQTKKVGDGSEPQTEQNVEADPNSPKAPADPLLAPGVAAKDVPGGEKKLKEAAKANEQA